MNSGFEGGVAGEEISSGTADDTSAYRKDQLIVLLMWAGRGFVPTITMFRGCGSGTCSCGSSIGVAIVIQVS